MNIYWYPVPSNIRHIHEKRVCLKLPSLSILYDATIRSGIRYFGAMHSTKRVMRMNKIKKKATACLDTDSYTASMRWCSRPNAHLRSAFVRPSLKILCAFVECNEGANGRTRYARIILKMRNELQPNTQKPSSFTIAAYSLDWKHMLKMMTNAFATGRACLHLCVYVCVFSAFSEFRKRLRRILIHLPIVQSMSLCHLSIERRTFIQKYEWDQ